MNESIICDRIALEVYAMIKSEHPWWPVVIYGIIITFVTITGILSNVSVIFVTIRTKSFRDSVNILLAFYSLCEICNLSGNFLSIFTAFSGHYFTTLKSGAYFVIIPFDGAGFAMNLMLFIGIERLFVVLFPLKNFNHKMFLVIVFECNLFFGIATAIILQKCLELKNDSIEIFANSYEIGQMIYNSEGCSFIVLVGLIILMLTVALYALIAVVLHFRKVFHFFGPSNANSVHFNKRIFRSLFTIVSVNFGGYLLALLAFFVILPMIHDKAMVLWHTTQIGGILLHISASSNGPILYWTSSEYREAFQKTFALILI